MNARLLLTAGALSLGLGLSAPAFAQQGAPMQPGMEGQMGQGQMGQGQMGDDMGQRPMKRSGKKMKKNMKGKKMMRSRGQGSMQGGMESGGQMQQGM